MQISKKQRVQLAISFVMVLALSLVTLWSPANFLVKSPKVDTDKQRADFQINLAKQRDDYRKMLADFNYDKEASKEVLQKVITEKEVLAIAEEELDTKQKVEIPAVKVAGDKVVNTQDAKQVSQYFEQHFKDKKQLTEKTAFNSMNLYRDATTTEMLEETKRLAQEYAGDLASTSVPQPAVKYHEAMLGAYQSYDRMVNLAKDYVPATGDGPWPAVYREWVIANEFANRAVSEIKNLEKQYAVSEVYASVYGEEAPWLARAGIVKSADALMLFGFQLTFEVGNIMEEIRAALASALAGFINKLFNRIIGLVEKNFAISNYLYYADALVTGQYAENFLDKYLGECVPLDANGNAVNQNQGGLVFNNNGESCARQGGINVGGALSNSLSKQIDKQIIKAFMPQFNCGELDMGTVGPLLQQKAQEYAGIDITQPLDTTSGDFYSTINKVNHLASEVLGQELLAKDAAEITTKRISESITNELLGSGKKAGRDANPATPNAPVSDPIIKLSVGSIQNASLSTLVGNTLLGTDRSTITINIASLVKTILSSFLNNFIFTTAKFVFKEQDRQSCVTGIPQASAIIPADIPDPGPDFITNDFIVQCRQNPEACAQGLINTGELGTGNGGGLPVVPPREPPLPVGGTGVVMDKACYAVGEVPRLAIRGASPNQLIYWSLYRQPSGQPVYEDINFEDANGPQITNAQGDWPSATGSVPDQAALTTADIGEWLRIAVVGGQEYAFQYRVVATTNECMPSR